MAADAWTIIIRLLALREHTRDELTQKLRARRFSASEIENAMQRLQDSDLQSDRRFCAAYIRQHWRRFGDFRLRAELKKRGVQNDNITAALAAAELSADAARALEVLEKKYPQGVEQANTATAQRFLSGRGFSNDSIRAALATLNNK